MDNMDIYRHIDQRVYNLYYIVEHIIIIYNIHFVSCNDILKHLFYVFTDLQLTYLREIKIIVIMCMLYNSISKNKIVENPICSSSMCIIQDSFYLLFCTIHNIDYVNSNEIHDFEIILNTKISHTCIKSLYIRAHLSIFPRQFRY